MKIDTVIKIGGSMIQDPSILKPLLKEISLLARSNELLIIPGGGLLADQIRSLDQEYKITAKSSHHMALLTLDIHAIFFHDLLQGTTLIENIKNLSLTSGVLRILQPSKIVLEQSNLPNSWDVTSDSIAAWIANKIQAPRLILVKDVDGLFQKDPKNHPEAPFIPEIQARDLEKWEEKTCVDSYISKHLTVPCFLVNGKHPDRIRAILSGNPTKTTLILPKLKTL